MLCSTAWFRLTGRAGVCAAVGLAGRYRLERLLDGTDRRAWTASRTLELSTRASRPSDRELEPANRNRASASVITCIWPDWVMLMARWEYPNQGLKYGGSMRPCALTHLPSQLLSGWTANAARPSDQIWSLTISPFQ